MRQSCAAVHACVSSPLTASHIALGELSPRWSDAIEKGGWEGVRTLIPLPQGSSMVEGAAMMGRRTRDQGKLFYEFRIEDRILENHLLRRMNVFVTASLVDLHTELEPFFR